MHVWPRIDMSVRSQVCPSICSGLPRIERMSRYFNFGAVGLVVHPMDRGTGPFRLREVPIANILLRNVSSLSEDNSGLVLVGDGGGLFHIPWGLVQATGSKINFYNLGDMGENSELV